MIQARCLLHAPMAWSDRTTFLRAWLRDPLRIGAALPSGRALTRLMTRDLSLADGPVVELGAGTGAFTRALIRRGVPEHRLALIEADAEFARRLVFRFPRARVLRMDAAHIDDVGSFFGGERAGSFLSSLPLRTMSMRRVLQLLRCAFRRHLRPDGAFYQYSYLPRCPIPARVLARLNLQVERLGWTAANLPPAFAYRLRRRG